MIGGTLYNEVNFIGKSAYIDWDEMKELWLKMSESNYNTRDKKISEDFPKYQLKVVETDEHGNDRLVPLTDGFKPSQYPCKVTVDNGYEFEWQLSVYSPTTLTQIDQMDGGYGTKKSVTLSLSDGSNKLGFYVEKLMEEKDLNKKSGNNASREDLWRWAGFNWLTIEAENPDLPWYKEICLVECQFKMNTNTTYKNGWPSENEENMTYFTGTNERSGSFTVKEDPDEKGVFIYESLWDFNPPDENVCEQKGDLLIKYDTQKQLITYFKCNSTSLCKDGYTRFQYVEGFDLPNTQNNRQNPGIAIIYSVTGSQAHTKITSFYSISDNPISTTETSGAPLADPDNSVSIHFMDPLGKN